MVRVGGSFIAPRGTVVANASCAPAGRTNEVKSVPTLHKEAGCVFEMVMFDCQERRHPHVRGNGKSGAKFWLEPIVEMASPGRYDENKLKQISRIIRENLATMTQRWDDECARVQAEGAAR